MNETDFQELAAKVVQGNDWIVLADRLRVAHHHAEKLQSLGAQRVFAIAAFRGKSLVPADLPYPAVSLDIQSDSQLNAIRSSIAAFRELPAHVKSRLDEWDPEKAALVFSPIWGEDLPLHDRLVFGARWPQWQRLENKMICDAMWDSIGIERAPAVIVPVYQGALESAHQSLDKGKGTVWVGDNKEGWHGGAEYLRWIQSPSDFRAAIPFFRSHCDQVRIQPFMDGIPCSIHGMVYPNQVISFRPCEMLVFRQKGSTRLRYAGAATAWDPDPHERQAMKAMARRVGAHLRSQHGYRGMFTIDGIMTSQGFRPTEINPRFGAATVRLLRGVPDLPLYILHKALCEGIQLDYDPLILESVVVDSADRHRSISASFSIPGGRPPIEAREIRYKRTEGGWTENEGSSQAIVSYSKSMSGGILGITIDPSVVQTGRSPANHIADLARMSAKRLGHGMDQLEPAPDVRF